MQALSGDGYGGVSKERLKKLSHDIDELVLEVSHFSSLITMS